jgi:hypothetical protein
MIQAGVKDERENLLSEISFTEEKCDETSNTLQAQIRDDSEMQSNAEGKLAVGMSQEANAAEQARQTSMENSQYNSGLTKKMKTCSKTQRCC